MSDTRLVLGNIANSLRLHLEQFAAGSVSWCQFGAIVAHPRFDKPIKRKTLAANESLQAL